MIQQLGKRGALYVGIGGTLILLTVIFQFVLKPVFARSKRLDKLIPAKAKKLAEMKELAAQHKLLMENQKRVALAIQKSSQKIPSF